MRGAGGGKSLPAYRAVLAYGKMRDTHDRKGAAAGVSSGAGAGAVQQGIPARMAQMGTLDALGALLFFLMEFAQYLPCYPRYAYTKRECTVISVTAKPGRFTDYETRWQDAQGNTYTMTASRKDYVGRTDTICTLYSNALRMHYELPRGLSGSVLIAAMLLVLFCGEIWWYVQYRKFRRRQIGTPQGEESP